MSDAPAAGCPDVPIKDWTGQESRAFLLWVASQQKRQKPRANMRKVAELALQNEMDASDWERCSTVESLRDFFNTELDTAPDPPMSVLSAQDIFRHLPTAGQDGVGPAAAAAAAAEDRLAKKVIWGLAPLLAPRKRKSSAVSGASDSMSTLYKRLRGDNASGLELAFLGTSPVAVTTAGAQVFDVTCDKLEAEVHAKVMEIFRHPIRSATQRDVYWKDTHAKHFLKRAGNHDDPGKAPDLTAVAGHDPGDGDPRPRSVVALIEVKKYNAGRFADSDLGKLCNDAMMVMSHQPQRRFILCALWDGTFAKIVRIERDEHGDFSTLDSKTLQLSDPEGAGVFFRFMTAGFSALGYDVGGVPADAGDAIGSGRTSVVYKHSTDSDRVFKVARLGRTVTHERAMLRTLDGAGGTIKLHDSDDASSDTVLTLTPVLRVPAAGLTLDPCLLPTLVDQLQVIHDKGVAHGDIREPNVMEAPDHERLLLVDFSAARLLGSEPCLPDHFSVQTASTDVLNALVDGKPYQLKAVHDMISFGRLVMLVLNPRDSPRCPLEAVSVHWAAVENKSQFHVDMATACAKDPPDYDSVRAVLLQNTLFKPPKPTDGSATGIT